MGLVLHEALLGWGHRLFSGSGGCCHFDLDLQQVSNAPVLPLPPSLYLLEFLTPSGRLRFCKYKDKQRDQDKHEVTNGLGVGSGLGPGLRDTFQAMC